MDPKNPPLEGDINLLVWGITFGILLIAAVVLAYLNREKNE